MELHLSIIGYLLVLLAIIHLIFPKYFNWKQDLNGLLLINRQMMYVHTFFIALVVLLIGLLCLTAPNELCETKLGSKIALGLFLFWFIRLLIQFFGYSSLLWKGKKLETTIHVCLTILWTYMSIVFFSLYWMNKAL